MREIKFKAKSIDNGEWVYGCYVNSGEYRDEEGKKLHFILEDDSGSYEDVIEVIPETLCQYTGLKDGNKIKIYEGDVVLMNSLKSDAYSFTIEYNDYRYMLYCNEFKEKIYWGDLQRSTELRNELEVTGNKHD